MISAILLGQKSDNLRATNRFLTNRNYNIIESTFDQIINTISVDKQTRYFIYIDDYRDSNNVNLMDLLRKFYPTNYIFVMLNRTVNSNGSILAAFKLINGRFRLKTLENLLDIKAIILDVTSKTNTDWTKVLSCLNRNIKLSFLIGNIQLRCSSTVSIYSFKATVTVIWSWLANKSYDIRLDSYNKIFYISNDRNFVINNDKYKPESDIKTDIETDIKTDIETVRNIIRTKSIIQSFD